MKRGDVLSFPDFVFSDGGHANKLLVVLNDQADTSGLVYCVLTTSQVDKSRKRDHGCQPSRKEFFLPSGKIFPKDTWILLGRKPFALPLHSVSTKIDSGECRTVATLPEQKVNEIRNCIDKHVSDYLSREECALLGIQYKG